MPYTDTFANLNGWVRSARYQYGAENNATVAGGFVIPGLTPRGAGGDYGYNYLRRAWTGQNSRVSYEITVLAGATAGTSGVAGTSNGGAEDLAYHCGVGYFKSPTNTGVTGICIYVAFGNNFYPFASLLSEANIVFGRSYNVQMMVEPTGLFQKTVTAQLYGPGGAFLGSAAVTANPETKASTFLFIGGNTDKVKISRFCADGWGKVTSTTAPYFRNPASCGIYGTTRNDGLGMYGLTLNARQPKDRPLVAVHFQGASGWVCGRAMNSSTQDYRRDDDFTSTFKANSRFGASMLEAGVHIVEPQGYSFATGVSDAWGAPTAYADARRVLQEVRAMLGDDTQFILVATSMGGLLAGELIARGEEQGIVGVVFGRAVTSALAAWNDSQFKGAVNAAWAINPADSAAAAAILNPYDAHYLIDQNPGRWKSKFIGFDYSTADTTVVPSSYSEVLRGKLDAHGIPYTTHISASQGHNDPWNSGNMRELAAEAIAYAQPKTRLLLLRNAA